MILASASESRAQLLRHAGVPFNTRRSGVDEAAIKQATRDAGEDCQVAAERLAEAKARAVAADLPNALVIGADQMLRLGDVWYDKPVDRTDAVRCLRELRGRTHELATACCVVRGGDVVWQHYAAPQLTMRTFDDTFIENYLDQIGDDACTVVGPYRIEDAGIQLFEKIEGDFFTILGLPLIPLLAFLRGRGIMAA